MIDRMATLRGGFLTTRACGPDGIYELKIKFQSLADLDAADQELRDAMEREKAHEGPLVGDQIPVSQFAQLHEPSGETEAPIVGAAAAIRAQTGGEHD
jgi:hypothetical protein